MVSTLPAALSRRAWLALLAGCAAVEETPPPRALDSPPAPVQPGGGGAPAAGTPLLTPWLSLQGAWRGALPGTTAAPAAPQRIQLLQPLGVAAQAELVVIYDAGLRQLLRWDRLRDQLTPLAAPGALGAPLAADHALGLQLLPDASVWLADPQAGRVLQLDALGRVRRTLADPLASRPVAVLQPPGTQDVLVADATDARVLVFSATGRVLTRWGGGKLQSIAAMAWGPEGLLVLDRLAQQVLLFDRNGRVLRSLGDDSLLQPRALAVDAHGRVYISDDADQRIHVFAGTERIARFGGAGNGPARFGRIAALAADGAQLYVADAANARVAVLLIAPPSLRGGV
jgi:hypothetical protein